MTFPVVGSNLPLPYEIDNSLRFNDGDTPYLTRSTGTTNKKTFTVSVWAKRSTLNARQTIWASDQNSNDTGDGSKGGSGVFIGFWNNGAFYFGGFGGSFQVRADGLQRDVSAWYHIVAQVDTTQSTTNDRGKLWINGVKQTTYTSMIGQNIDVKWATNRIGVRSDVANYSDSVNFTAYMDGYLAELHVVDGQTLTASDFGEYDESSGVWKPKIYEGTHGTDGYYLKFNNTGNMGEDSSGNDNTFTPTNLSGTTDVTTDTPTNNFATMSSIDTNEQASLSEGNTQLQRGSNYAGCNGTFGLSSGKWYWEVKTPTPTTSGENESFGVSKVPHATIGNNYLGINTNSWAIMIDNAASDIYKNHNNSFTDTGINASANDIFNIALDMDNNKVYFGRNGTYFDSGDPAAGTNPTYSSVSGDTHIYPAFSMNGNDTLQVNFGNPAFSISSGNTDDNGYGNFEYAPPSGYLALCTQNLATALSPTIDDGSEYFNTVLYTGTGSSQSITGVGFQPDWTWIKCRSVARDHTLTDSTRGATKTLVSNTTGAETTDSTGLTSFDSDGFTLGGANAFNGNTETHVAWNWLANGGTTSSNTDGSITSTVQANTTAGFSIVTYTGTGSNATVGHGLGKALKFLIVKDRDASEGWIINSQILTGNTNGGLHFNTDAEYTGASTQFQATNPTSTVFYIGTAGNVNISGDKYVAYCFAEIEGYSKFGTYTGNGSSDGTFVYTGFRPSFIIGKKTSGADNWYLMDTKRLPFNSSDGDRVFPNLSNAESTDGPRIDFVSNGFKIKTSAGLFNDSGASYIYMAFAENPFVTSGAVPVTAR